MTPEQAAPAALQLPPNVVSRADVLRLVGELERVDSELTTNAVRGRLSVEAVALPPVSDQLADFVRQNALSFADSKVRESTIRQLRALSETAPVIHMTFAVEADRESLRLLAQWLRQQVHPQAVISVGLQPGLVAGVYLRTTNKVLDLSLKGALKGGREILTKDLEALRGRV